jgi:hypothetical protein
MSAITLARFELPNRLVRNEETATDTYAQFIAEPFERGYGHTIGNSLRRVLLSSLEGASITSVRIAGVQHEFSSLPGVVEDVTDIVLNLKGVRLKMDVEGPKRLSISAKGPGVVTAGDISESSGIEILNREHVICHLDDGADVFMELTVNTGKGYVSADKNRPEDAPIGLIPIDAIFSPIPGVAAISTNEALRIALTDPKRSRRAALRICPSCSISSSTDSSMTFDLRDRWKVIAKRCASSRMRCRRYIPSLVRGRMSGSWLCGSHTSSRRFAKPQSAISVIPSS